MIWIIGLLVVVGLCLAWILYQLNQASELIEEARRDRDEEI